MLSFLFLRARVFDFGAIVFVCSTIRICVRVLSNVSVFIFPCLYMCEYLFFFISLDQDFSKWGFSMYDVCRFVGILRFFFWIS